MTLSGLDSAALAELLAEIRRVAQLMGAEALEATDLLAWTILERHGSALGADDAAIQAEEVARARRELDRVRGAVQARNVRPAWDAEGLRTEARLLADSDPELAAECRQVADEADRLVQVLALERAGSQPIHSAGSTPGILAQIARAEQALQALGGMTPELVALARSARERCADYRWTRKLADAEVAQVSSEERAQRLREEGRVMRFQDWKAYLGEAPPDA